jgi:DNA-binding CsgD family transcriptional regulator
MEVGGLRDDSRKCDLLLGLGEALLAAGEIERVLEEVAPAALALAQIVGDDARAFQACRIALSSPVFSPEWLATAQEYVGDDPIARISLNQALSVRAFHDGRFGDHKAVLLEALELARSARRPDLVIASALGLIRSGDLSVREERDLFDELIAQPRQGISPEELANFQSDAVMTHLQWGERGNAEAERQRLAELAAQTGHHRAVVNSRAVDCLFDTLDGRLSEAIKHRPGRGTYPHAWRGRLAGWLGDAGVLEAELAWSEDLVARSALGPAFKAFFLAYLGRVDEARETLAEILAGLEATSKARITSYWLSTLLLEAAVICRDKAAARVLLDLNGRDERILAKPLFVLVPRHLAGAAALLGDLEAAKAGYLEAIQFCERLDYRPELALTRLDLAELLLKHYPGERTAAFQHLDFAIAEFEAMGMRPSLERALRLRGRRRRAAQPRAQAYPAHLSAREVEVLRLVANGKSNQQIAGELAISLNTVMRHVSNILNKTGAANRTEASSYAHRQSLV